MSIKYAVALTYGINETILGVFKTKDEADLFGYQNKIPHEAGLQYCFSAPFSKGRPHGNSIKIYNYYNV